MTTRYCFVKFNTDTKQSLDELIEFNLDFDTDIIHDFSLLFDQINI